jgi:DNA-binding response OmpR family regulator
VDNADLAGCTILIVEKEPLIALDAQVALEDAGGRVCVVGNVADAVKAIEEEVFTAAVVDWRPGSDAHRIVARALKQKRVPYLFYATDAPNEVTTVRGAPIVLKPARREDIVKAVALLAGRLDKAT